MQHTRNQRTWSDQPQDALNDIHRQIESAKHRLFVLETSVRVTKATSPSRQLSPSLKEKQHCALPPRSPRLPRSQSAGEGEVGISSSSATPVVNQRCETIVAHQRSGGDDIARLASPPHVSAVPTRGESHSSPMRLFCSQSPPRRDKDVCGMSEEALLAAVAEERHLIVQKQLEIEKRRQYHEAVVLHQRSVLHARIAVRSRTSEHQ